MDEILKVIRIYEAGKYFVISTLRDNVLLGVITKIGFVKYSDSNLKDDERKAIDKFIEINKTK